MAEKYSQRVQGGKRFYEVPIGILCLDSLFPKLRGHMRNPRTYSFPTVTHVISGLSIQKLLFDPSPEMLAPLIEAAQCLEKEGVHAITGSCGFLARFQREVAASVKVPVFLSSLLLIPLIKVMHGANARIGVLTASAKSLTQEHFSPFGEDIRTVFIQGMEGNAEFESTILQGLKHDFDLLKLEGEIVGTALSFIQEKQLDALLLECTDLPPFAKPIQQQSSVPVYDINALMHLMESSVGAKF